MAINDLRNKLKTRKSYLKKGKQWLADNFGCTIQEVESVLNELQTDVSTYRAHRGTKTQRQLLTYLEKIRKRHPEVKAHEETVEGPPVKVKPFKKGDPNNVLYIGDLHAPFTLEGYLDFNLDLQKKYNCGTVIFAGDIVDGHSWSYHEHDVDGMAVKEELVRSIELLQPWYKAFPEATITYGNHDLLIMRKARTAGLSRLFIRHLQDIIEAPESWHFVEDLIRDDVYYTHGSIGNAFKRATAMRKSVAQGHLHSESFVQWSVSEIDAIFGLQVGCGIDRHQYAFEYGKPYAKKPIIGSGVILDKGRLPIVELMRI